MRNAIEPIRLSHLRTLTTGTGIIQHGWYSLPNERTGYCTDDNSRALLVALEAYRHSPDPELLRLIGTYLSFIRAARNERGAFCNFMSYQQSFLDNCGSEDCLGRVLWVLGYAMHYPPHPHVAEVCAGLFDGAFDWLSDIHSARGRSYCLLGLRHFQLARPDDPRILPAIQDLASGLAGQFDGYATPEWPWFEWRLTYGNGIPPMALLAAADATGEHRYSDIALRALDWLTSVLIVDGVMAPIGCNGWYDKGKKRSLWDQQPLDPAGMVFAYLAAARYTGDKGYRDLAESAYAWFHGANMNHLSLVDPITGGCCDALTREGRNDNQGAESSLAYYLASLTIRENAPVVL